MHEAKRALLQASLCLVIGIPCVCTRYTLREGGGDGGGGGSEVEDNTFRCLLVEKRAVPETASHHG